MRSAYSFRPRGWAFGLALAACAAGIALGNWQSQRAEQKRILGAQLEQARNAAPVELAAEIVDPETIVLKRVSARGHFEDQYTVFLDNKLRRGRPGYEVVTPLRLNGVYVLVNRGWVPAGPRRDELPRVSAPSGDVRIVGLALARLPHALAAGPATPGKVRQNLDLKSFAEETKLRLQPVVIEQHSWAADGLTRDWPRPDVGIEKHESYALQWYSLAGLSVILFIVLSLRRVPAP